MFLLFHLKAIGFKKKQCFQLKTLLCFAIISSPLVSWWIIFGKMVWEQVPAVLKFLTLCAWFMADHACWLWVFVLQAILCFSWWEGLSALALMFLILTTTVKACSKAPSVGYASFIGHNIQSGVIFHVAISVSLLVFVVFRLKLTLGCFSAVMLSFRYASD